MRGWFYRFVRWCPGALGLLLRQKLYPRILGSCGKGVLFGRFVDLYAVEKIKLGDRVVLNNNAVLDARAFGQAGPAVVVEENVFIGTGTRLRTGAEGSITIRTGTNLSSFCNLVSEVPLTIGRHCLIAAYCGLGESLDRNGKTGAESGTGNCQDKSTVVGDGCWLGVRMQLKEGVAIGRDTIVGAHAIVQSDLPAYGIAIGQPAKVIMDRRAGASGLETRPAE